jgi:hypothetical protein
MTGSGGKRSLAVHYKPAFGGLTGGTPKRQSLGQSVRPLPESGAATSFAGITRKRASGTYARRTPVNSISPFIMSIRSFRYATG